MSILPFYELAYRAVENFVEYPIQKTFIQMREFSWFIAFALIVRGAIMLLSMAWIFKNIRTAERSRFFIEFLFILHFSCSFARWSSYLSMDMFVLTCHRYGIIPLVWRWSLISMQKYIRKHTQASAIELEIAHRKQIVTAGNNVKSTTVFFSLWYEKKWRKKPFTVKALILKMVCAFL